MPVRVLSETITIQGIEALHGPDGQGAVYGQIASPKQQISGAKTACGPFFSSPLPSLSPPAPPPAFFWLSREVGRRRKGSE